MLLILQLGVENDSQRSDTEYQSPTKQSSVHQSALAADRDEVTADELEAIKADDPSSTDGEGCRAGSEGSQRGRRTIYKYVIDMKRAIKLKGLLKWNTTL